MTRRLLSLVLGLSALFSLARATTAQWEPDLTAWDFWWAYNQEPYLELKSHVFRVPDPAPYDWHGRRLGAVKSLAPTAEQIREEIRPALRRTLREATSDDLVTACLIALAKVGEDPSASTEAGLAELLATYLADSRPDVRESATIALGILGSDRSVGLLGALLLDTPEGRDRTGGTRVPYRVRAFAGYALGLTGSRTASEEVRRGIVGLLGRGLRSDERTSRDVAVACVIALGLVPLETMVPPTERPSPRGTPATRLELLDFLLALFTEPSTTPIVRGHAATALARLHEGLPGEQARELRPRIAWTLLDAIERAPLDSPVIRSAALALGALGDGDSDPLDCAIRKTLKELSTSAGRATSGLSLIALARQAGKPGTGEGFEENLLDVGNFLLEGLGERLASDRQWPVLATGVLGHGLREAGVDSPVAERLVAKLRELLLGANMSWKLGPLAIGIGLLGDIESAERLREKLTSTRDSETRGYVALGLGLLGDREAIEPLQEVVADSRYKPELMRQTAIALGLLGDKEIMKRLADMLADAKGLATQAAVSSALAMIGDRRAIDPLVEMLENDELTEIARGFAAVALGIVADKELLPWNTRIAFGIDYLDAPPTLTRMEGTGVLNILVP